MKPDSGSRPKTAFGINAGARTLAEFAAVAAVYYVLAKFGLMLASVNPSATPIWPPTGFALAMMLLCGYRVAPAIFAGAFLANATTAGTIYTSAAIATGNVVEAVVGAYLINTWAGGRNAFGTALGVAKFALAEIVTTPVSATIGAGSLALAGFVSWDSFTDVWRTWWLGDLASGLVIAPVVVLWATTFPRKWDRDDLLETAAIFVMTAVIGLIAFVPVSVWANARGAAFLVILPLMWAALRRGPRDTASVALILAAFAVWGIMANGGPFSDMPLSEAFFLLLIFMISTSVPSLALSADVEARKRTEEKLEERVQQRTAALLSEIEQRKLVEAEKEQQRLQLVEAQRLANLGSWVWDVQRGKVSWSDQLFKIYGIRPQDFMGTLEDFSVRLHPDDRSRVERIITESAAGGQGFQTRERIVRPDGGVRHLRTSGEVVKDAGGNVTQMIGICQDVTDVMEAEHALERSEENYRLIIDGMRDHAIFMLDTNGRIVTWNPGAARIKGYDGHEIVGKHLSQFYTDEDRKIGIPARAIETAVNEGKYESEGLRVRKDGTSFWAHVVLTAIRDNKGKLVGFVKITRDVTERHEALRKLDETREQLFQAQKMEAVGQLTGGIAHDFNNLLTAILGSASIVERVAGDNAQLLRNARNIRYAAERGANLTRQLLSFARRQSLHPEVVDLRQKLPLTAELLAHSLRGDIKVSTHVDADIHLIKLDTGEFDLALLNIAVNAQDAMPEGGSLTIRVRNCVLDDITAGLRGDFVAVSLTDTGAGMTPEVQTKIFEPFFTTKETGKGSGLGLSQVYGFAQQSGGTVKVESQVGKGTTLTLLLPAAAEELAKAGEPAGEGQEAVASAIVLLVEDDPEVARTTRETLVHFGFRVHSAANASSALDMIEKTPQIDVMFSDVVMPGGMNGVELARAVRRAHPDMPILLTSGFSDAVSAQATQEFIFLRKPYLPNDLKHHIDMLLQMRQA